METQPRVILTYVPGLTEQTVRLISRKLGNPAGYVPHQRMSSLLSTYKDKTPCVRCGIYQIECACGEKYIGQTGRDISDRLQEHQRSTKNADTERSAVSEHFWNDPNENHSILWDQAKIIDQEQRWMQRIIKESIYIQKARREGLPLMNRKYECPNQKLLVCYNEVLDQLFIS